MNNDYKLIDSIILANSSNQCYLNCVLQMLYSINEVRNYILDYSNILANYSKSNIILGNIKKIFNYINNGKNEGKNKISSNVLTPIYISIILELLNILINNSNLNNKYKEYKDSFEFLEFIMSMLNGGNNNITYNFNDSNIMIKTTYNNVTNLRYKNPLSIIIIIPIIEQNPIINNIFNNISSIKDINNIIKNNKYLILVLHRFDDKGNFINKNINIHNNNNNVKLINNNYRLLSCILFKPSHYIYVTFKNDGSIHLVYDDVSKKASNTLPDGFKIEENSYILLYYITNENNLIKLQEPLLKPLESSQQKQEEKEKNIKIYYSLKFN